MWNSNITKTYAAQTEELDAEFFNGNQYKVFDDNLSWSDAKAYCESLGGHLATVESEEENNFIFSIIQNKEKSIYWLGAFLRINCGNSGSAKQWNDFADSENIWGSSTRYLGFVCEWENEDESYGSEVIDLHET